MTPGVVKVLKAMISSISQKKINCALLVEHTRGIAFVVQWQTILPYVNNALLERKNVFRDLCMQALLNL